jgi:site-specific DNA recombinase
VFIPDPKTKPIAVKAFRMRADGATIAQVRQFLREHGIERSYHGVGALLRSRVVLGELHFGNYEPNLEAHDAIVDRELWRRVQRARATRGRKPKSDRLLARLGVLRCGSCGARMVVGSSHHGRHAIYRCPPTGDCKRRVTISAEMVETIVTEQVRAALADVEGRASAEQGAQEAARALERAQSDLEAALRVLSDFDDEQAAKDRLSELRAARDAARERVEQLGGQRAAVVISGAGDWDQLSLAAQRELIRATVARVLVAPGRGDDRVTVDFVGS